MYTSFFLKKRWMNLKCSTFLSKIDMYDFYEKESILSVFKQVFHPFGLQKVEKMHKKHSFSSIFRQ